MIHGRKHKRSDVRAPVFTSVCCYRKLSSIQGLGCYDSLNWACGSVLNILLIAWGSEEYDDEPEVSMAKKQISSSQRKQHPNMWLVFR